MKSHKHRGPFLTSANAKKAGWFSRRHKTSEAHREAQERHAQRRKEKLARARRPT